MLARPFGVATARISTRENGGKCRRDSYRLRGFHQHFSTSDTAGNILPESKKYQINAACFWRYV
jgi:hypothetical protein